MNINIKKIFAALTIGSSFLGCYTKNANAKKGEGNNSQKPQKMPECPDLFSQDPAHPKISEKKETLEMEESKNCYEDKCLPVTLNNNSSDTLEKKQESSKDKYSENKIAELKILMEELKNCYEVRSLPGTLYNSSSDTLEKELLENSDKYCKSVRIYYDDFCKEKDLLSHESIIKQLAVRNPVNIMMGVEESSFDNVKKFIERTPGCTYEKFLGQSESFYTKTYREKSVLPPNISLYCKTPIRNTDYSGNKTEIEEINLISIIGYGFDNKNQPDFQYFLNDDTKKQNKERFKSKDLIEEYEHRVDNIFAKIFKCAEDHSLNAIHMVSFGCSFFGGPIMDFHKEVFVKKMIKYANCYEGIKIISTDNLEDLWKNSTSKKEPMPDLPNNILTNFGAPWYKLSNEKNYNKVRFFSDDYKKKLEEINLSIEKVLAVNSWDPHSFDGNGNKRDGSTDGFYGRHTMIAALCHPSFNTYLNKDNKNIFIKISLDS